MLTYIQKVRNSDGSFTTIEHKCEIIDYKGKNSAKIRIYGSFYNGRLNATPTVRLKSILEFKKCY